MGIGLIAGGGGLGRASPGSHGDLLLDYATGDNTDLSFGTLDTACQQDPASPLRVDVIARNAVDWAGMAYIVNFPTGASFDHPGPLDAGVDQLFTPSAGFDFVPLDFLNPGPTAGSNNFMSSAAGSAVLYGTTEAVPDVTSPHGISEFDPEPFLGNSTGESGNGGMARITLDISSLPAGAYTISLGLNATFGGGVHTSSSGFVPDNFGQVQFAKGVTCPAPTATATPTPAPTATATPTPAATATATPTPTPLPTPAPGHDAQLRRIQTSFSVLGGLFDAGSPDEREIFVQIRNDGDHQETIGVYLDVIPPPGGGCLPAGRILEGSITLEARGTSGDTGNLFADTHTPDLAGSETGGVGHVDFSCTNQSAVVGETYTLIAVVDAHGDDLASCGASTLLDIGPFSCFSELATDDTDPTDNRLSRSAPRVKKPQLE